MEFLELDTRTPALLITGPNLVGKHGESRSIMDIQFITEGKLLVLVNADLSGFIQKSGLFSFGKKKEAPQTPGNIAGYIQGKTDATQIGDYNFQQQWWMNYPSPATKALWCPKLELLICGEDSGMMHFLKPSLTNTLKCEEAFAIKVHSDRLTALAVDEEKRQAYSVAEDRKFKVIDVDKKRVSSEFEISNKKVTCMHVDTEGRLAFVGDAEGNVKVVDLAKNPPSCICSIKVTSKDSIVSLNLVNKVLYSACAESGKIFVHTIGDVRNAAVGDHHHADTAVDVEVFFQQLSPRHHYQVLERSRRALRRSCQRSRRRLQQICLHRLSLL